VAAAAAAATIQMLSDLLRVRQTLLMPLKVAVQKHSMVTSSAGGSSSGSNPQPLIAAAAASSNFHNNVE
jgi:hypothetical protein